MNFFLQASTSMQDLEEERLKTMQDYLNKYNSHVSVLPPKLTQVRNSLPCSVNRVTIKLRHDIKMYRDKINVFPA